MSHYAKVHGHPYAALWGVHSLSQFAQAPQQDPTVRGYRSFANLSRRKVVCILEAPSKEDLAAWFQKMGLPYDSIIRLELEGDRGVIEEV